MKKRTSTKLAIFAVAALLLLAMGCTNGGNDDDDADSSVQPSMTSGPAATVNLQVGVPVAVNEGDQVIPGSADTRIRVTHTLGATKEVTLLSGTAELIRGDFSLARRS